MPLKRWFIGLIFLLVGFEIYTRFPSFAVPLVVQVPAETRNLVLVIHGSGGANDLGLQVITKTFADSLASNHVAQFINWSPSSDNIFRASAHGQHLAEWLGADLAKQSPRLQRLTLVAHSAGAYWLEPLCEAYRVALKAQSITPAFVEMIYLDPIGTKGSWDYGYGYRHYGHCADFARAFINLDDAVPGTNGLLVQAHNIDVTQAKSKAAFLRQGGDGHYWPVSYFLALPAEQQQLSLESMNQPSSPRTSVEIAN
jgi:hypothetical protein